MEEEAQEVEQKVDEIKQKPHISFDKQAQQQEQAQQVPPVQNRSFLITVSDAETQINLGVIAPNIIVAIAKFIKKYQNDFDDLFFLNLNIEEIEFLG